MTTSVGFFLAYHCYNVNTSCKRGIYHRCVWQIVVYIIYRKKWNLKTKASWKEWTDKIRFITYHGLVVESISTRADNWCLKVSPTVGFPLVVLEIVWRPPRSSNLTPSRSWNITLVNYLDLLVFIHVCLEM